jgi:hypothetical protein
MPKELTVDEMIDQAEKVLAENGRTPPSPSTMFIAFDYADAMEDCVDDGYDYSVKYLM